jgi:uncharacterized heparinase superfamily protein
VSVAGTLPRWLRTVRPLRPRQIAALIHQRLGPRPAVPRTPEVAQADDLRFDTPFIDARPSGSGMRFRFLNDTREFDPGRFDWHCRDRPRLWRYNLHYFDFAFDPVRPPEEIEALIADWIAANPAPHGEGWDPYPLSLRLVNWIKFAARRRGRPYSAPVANSLAGQAAWLERSIEHHLLGNHLLKNIKALIFCGAWLRGVAPSRWLRTGLALLGRELAEQLLADGGHFERSPMYHAIVTEDLLDLLNLIRSNSRLRDVAGEERLRRSCAACLDYLVRLTAPDGSLFAFNDCAAGIAPSTAALLDYAERVFGYSAPAVAPGLEMIALAASGYYLAREGGDTLVIDCGDLGPRYQPGHGHCDTLSYALVFDGRHIVIDTGVFDYEPGRRREHARGTRAHNSVMVDGVEQSEIWAVFRVGRRARPGPVRFERIGEEVRFEGSHDGYRHLPGAPRHVRELIRERNGGIRVLDRIEGDGVHRAESFVHLAPGLQVLRDGRAVRVVDQHGDCVATLDALRCDRVSLEADECYPEFGSARSINVVKLSSEGHLPITQSYRIGKGRWPS